MQGVGKGTMALGACFQMHSQGVLWLLCVENRLTPLFQCSLLPFPFSIGPVCALWAEGALPESL